MNGQLQYNRGLTEPRLPRSALAVRVTAVMLLCFLGWAWYFQLDEVTTGSGTVEPSGREQVVQSLEGGILYHLDVKVGDIVEQASRWRSLTAPKRNPTSRKRCRGCTRRWQPRRGCGRK